MKRFLKTCVFQKKQRAFSLVEVLCAVVLLALIATPILQALYSGMVVNNKSRKLLAAADLCSDTCEFVSSLAFEDYTHKVGAVDYTVPGLKSYYWGNDIDASHPSIEFTSFKLRATHKLYPGGPTGDLLGCGMINHSDFQNGTYQRYVKYENVKMDGYIFDVKIETKVPDKKVVLSSLSSTYVYEDFKGPDITGEQYFSYDVTVYVYEHGSTAELISASTTVPNKF